MSNYSGPPDEAPTGFLPWFRISNRRSSDATIITGHWAALGLHIEPNVLAIDSGCVWGRQLTAIRLEDRTIHQVEYADRREGRAAAAGMGPPWWDSVSREKSPSSSSSF